MPILDAVDTEQIRAPFTRNQVWSINAYQDAALDTQLTCPQCQILRQGTRMSLTATTLGMICSNNRMTGCTYTQNWAYKRMGDWSWKPRPDSLAPAPRPRDPNDTREPWFAKNSRY